jgi:hypothetical protein
MTKKVNKSQYWFTKNERNSMNCIKKLIKTFILWYVAKNLINCGKIIIMK